MVYSCAKFQTRSPGSFDRDHLLAISSSLVLQFEKFLHSTGLSSGVSCAEIENDRNNSRTMYKYICIVQYIYISSRAPSHVWPQKYPVLNQKMSRSLGKPWLNQFVVFNTVQYFRLDTTIHHFSSKKTKPSILRYTPVVIPYEDENVAAPQRYLKIFEIC